ncbi:MAG TPA: hypothetical protein VE078_04135, partial [Thermoanaerobaculia bacterium]|nr:hypothetical protein [Thermoanaerobaculia bacterium]
MRPDFSLEHSAAAQAHRRRGDPQLGFGVFQVPPAETAESVTRALQTVEEAIQWATEGNGYASDRLIEHMRAAEGGTGAFAVGFVSVMAGAMLA